jgi:hypothetical protein
VPAPIAALAVAGCGAAMLAGCGTATLSGGQLRTRAAQICTIASSEFARIPNATSPGRARAFVRAGIAVIAPEQAELRRLTPPSELAALWGHALDLGERELAALRQTARELGTAADPVTAVRTLEQRLAPLEAAATSAWQALAVPACIPR